MKAKEIGDSFSTQKFSIGVSSAGINAKKYRKAILAVLGQYSFGCYFQTLSVKFILKRKHSMIKTMLVPTMCSKEILLARFENNSQNCTVQKQPILPSGTFLR